MSFSENTKVSVYDFYRPLTGMRKQTGDVGLEIEAEGNIPMGGFPAKGWEPHLDNSLRGPGGQGQGGIEYITRGAVAFSDVNRLVYDLRAAFNKAGVVCRDDSPRTSTHIHLNVQDMPLIDVFGYITVFAAVEPLFLHLCGPRRDGNSFCANSFDTGDLPDYFHEVFRQIEGFKQESGSLDFSQRGKYASLGTFRLHDLGTLEGRCFPFSLDPDLIQSWCSWMINLRDLVLENEDKSCRSLIKLGLHDPMILANRIFGDMKGVSGYLASELIQYGSREAYELTRLLKFFLNKKPEEKKLKSKKTIEPVFPEAATQFQQWAAALPNNPPRAPRSIID